MRVTPKRGSHKCILERIIVNNYIVNPYRIRLQGYLCEFATPHVFYSQFATKKHKCKNNIRKLNHINAIRVTIYKTTNEVGIYENYKD